MHFPDFSFDAMNEADVREELIGPLLRELGYQAGTENNIARETSLRYRHVSLGRKKPNKDPSLHGIADYICEVRGVARWVIEAKSPASELSKDDIEQAYTYAVHPEVQAIYFAVCNGRRFALYESMRGPKSDPLVDFTYDELRNKTEVRTNILSPESIWRDRPVRAVDIGQPLGRGLRSQVHVVGGAITYEEFVGHPSTLDQNFTPFRGLIIPIVGGKCYRTPNGQIEVCLRTAQINSPLEAISQNLGLGAFSVRTSEAEISTDPDKPNLFEGTHETEIPAGTELFDLSTWKPSRAPFPMKITTYTEAVGHLNEVEFSGSFYGRIEYILNIHGSVTFPFIVDMEGTFSLSLSR